MKKSKDFEELKYIELRKEVQEAVSDKPDIIRKKAKLTFDGRQYVVRIPTGIAKVMGITSDHVMKFEATIPTPKGKGKRKLHIRIVEI